MRVGPYDMVRLDWYAPTYSTRPIRDLAVGRMGGVTAFGSPIEVFDAPAWTNVAVRVCQQWPVSKSLFKRRLCALNSNAELREAMYVLFCSAVPVPQITSYVDHWIDAQSAARRERAQKRGGAP